MLQALLFFFFYSQNTFISIIFIINFTYDLWFFFTYWHVHKLQDFNYVASNILESWTVYGLKRIHHYNLTIIFQQQHIFKNSLYWAKTQLGGGDILFIKKSKKAQVLNACIYNIKLLTLFFLMLLLTSTQYLKLNMK